MNQKKTAKKPKRSNPRQKQPTRAVREFTAGGIIFRRRTDADVDILMIQDRLGRWTIPKGHVEKGESLEQTALREVREETGLRALRIRDKLDKIHFFYRREGKLIFMTTYVYLIEAIAETDKLVPENNEGITDVKWFDKAEALELIEYKQTQQLMRIGLDKLEMVAK